MAVSGQGETVVEVGFRLLVLDVACVDLGIKKRDPAGDAFLLRGEQIEGQGSGVVNLQQLGALVPERVAFEFVGVSLLRGGGLELVKLAGDELAQSCHNVVRDLDAAVVVLDRSFNIRDQHRALLTVGALGVTTGTDEVRVDHALSTLRVGQHQP
ncbi:hypothetical protein [Microbacterium esteraromaticum]|uniref:hypothetical protein n=1 Tax=Microbacterium esteraromaticum TaxID=57043 RepID=UPI00211ABA2C|nr:hypothetical protein [Microbacterium esteraromaticum]